MSHIVHQDADRYTAITGKSKMQSPNKAEMQLLLGWHSAAKCMQRAAGMKTYH